MVVSQRDEITILLVTQRDEITRIIAVWLSRARSCKMRRKGTKGISPRFVIESTRTYYIVTLLPRKGILSQGEKKFSLG